MEEIHISDHFLVYSKLELKRPKPEKIYITCRSYKHYDAHDIVEDLLQVPWYENSLIGDVNGKVEHFDANFGIGQACPYQEYEDQIPAVSIYEPGNKTPNED